MSKATEHATSLLIPAPKKLVREPGEIVLTGIRSECAEFEQCAKTFCECTEKIYDKKVFSSGDGNIVLVFDPTLKKSSYVIDVTDEGARLSACDSEGILYAIASLISIIVMEKDEPQVNKLHIEDAPDKDYRALMVDLAREWHAPKTVLHFIDVCFMLKVRYLHLHFIDNQRYTLPSRIYPDVTKYNRHYTFEDIEKFREYANARGVIIVPEFEVPGHATAMIKAYPEVFGLELTGDSSDATITTESGEVINAKGIVCAGSEACEKAVQALLAEICEMFPETPYIHIGGDEANIKAWNYCAKCQKYMSEHNIADVKELYSEFTGRVAQMVLDLGKTPIVWEGFPKEGVHHIPKDTIVIAWESHYHMAYDLLDEGFRIINGSWQPLYIVNSYTLGWNSSHIYNWNVYNLQHWWSNSEATLNPINLQPTDRVLGAQVSSWECTFEQEIGKVMENLATLSERTWNVRRNCAYGTFAPRLNRTLQRICRLIQDV